jgi:thiopurine S-methyltransferase
MATELYIEFCRSGVSSMSNQIWEEMWKRNDIAFHQNQANPLLQTYIPRLNLPEGSTILVPMCGKSLDMSLLAGMGYHVLGIELSNIAIRAYFAAAQEKPTRQKAGQFLRWQAGNTELWCGDIFDLTAHDIGHVHLLYDNASLTALPTEDRARYIEHFRNRLAPDSETLLITTESAEHVPSLAGNHIDSEIQSLYTSHYQIELLHCQGALLQDPSHPHATHTFMEEKVYWMKPRMDQQV